MSNADLNLYTEFVGAVTSYASEDVEEFIRRIRELEEVVNVPLLVTGSTGMASESGEFSDYVKKCLFHGKPLDDEVHTQLKRELGDVIWYWTNCCRALGLDPSEVIQGNVEKLKKRYPGGEFSVYHSENRAEDDT